MKSAVKVPEVGIHVLHIGRGDAIIPIGEFLIQGGAQVKQDTFIEQGDNGFIGSVERQLTSIGCGKIPKHFLLVVCERLEDSYLPFYSGDILRYLDDTLADIYEDLCNEAGCSEQQYNANDVPILVCVLGESDAFQRYIRQEEQQTACYKEHPAKVLNRKQAEQLFEDIKRIHASSVAGRLTENKDFPTPGGVG